ncbi:MAG: hypothetical protein QGG40_08825 [Myxococcota bacterium]|jgi:FMN phosphatase YigB (HAD superfamily)|nr:hypothetical protein [Myxococcota bacterium]
MSSLLVLDFDGTMTDAEEEGRPFREGYLEDLAALTARPLDQIRSMAEEIEMSITHDTEAHGWRFEGRIVAPACVDPYLRIMPVARGIFDQFGAFPDEHDRTRLLDRILYKYNYGKTSNVFRDGAHAALRRLEGTATYVVTNSHTRAVQDKIASLGDVNWLIDRVHGNARKYQVDDTFAGVPETLQLPGLTRPVLLRRRLYHDALEGLRHQVGCSWSEVTVVGDIFELDLALPLALGCRVGIVPNEFTPRYELAYLDAHPRAQRIESLSELPTLVKD